MPQTSVKYSPISKPDDDSTERLLNQPSDYTFEKPFRPQTWYRFWPWVANGTLLALSVVFFTLSMRIQLPTTAQCVKQLSTFSPIQESIEYQRVKFNGTFDYPSVYRGLPNPELDAAWDRISQNVQPTRISKDVLEKIGKIDRPSLVKLREEDGGGYLASIESTHQLHCLNLLRKYTYHEYYEPFDPSFQAKPEVFRTHLDHCVEMIRRNLMCTGDVGLITYEWVEGWDLPYPDFNTWHQCRNFEKILEWGYSNSIHIPRAHVTRFGDEVDLPEPP